MESFYYMKFFVWVKYLYLESLWCLESFCALKVFGTWKVFVPGKFLVSGEFCAPGKFVFQESSLFWNVLSARKVFCTWIIQFQSLPFQDVIYISQTGQGKEVVFEFFSVSQSGPQCNIWRGNIMVFGQSESAGVTNNK